MRARSTRLAGSVRDRAINLNFSTSKSPSDNSIARRHAAISLSPSFQSPPPHIWELETADESHPYDNFLGIGRLVTDLVMHPCVPTEYDRLGGPRSSALVNPQNDDVVKKEIRKDGADPRPLQSARLYRSLLAVLKVTGLEPPLNQAVAPLSGGIGQAMVSLTPGQSYPTQHLARQSRRLSPKSCTTPRLSGFEFHG